MEDFEQIKENNNDNLNATTKSFLKAISTTCRAMGHTEQAAKYGRRCCFAMLDYFGLNSLFLSTTPGDKCSFRVRLYCKPQYWVRPTMYSKMEFFVFFFVFYKECLLFCNTFVFTGVISIFSKREYFVFYIVVSYIRRSSVLAKNRTH